jgi:hypothetical protein
LHAHASEQNFVLALVSGISVSQKRHFFISIPYGQGAGMIVSVASPAIIARITSSVIFWCFRSMFRLLSFGLH